MGGNQAWSSQVVIANKVIIEGDNDYLLIYDGDPGPGNLAGSIASMDGTDEFGNAFKAGISVYYSDGLTAAAMTIDPASSVTSYSDDDVPISAGAFNGTVVVAGGPALNLFVSMMQVQWRTDLGAAEFTTYTAANNQTSMLLKPATTGHNAWQPENEVWQNPAYGAGWAGAVTFSGLTGQTLQFRRMAEDDLWIQGCAATTGVGVAAFTIPLGDRRPKAGTNPHGSVKRLRAGVVSVVEVSVSGSTGVVTIGSAAAASDQYSFDCRIPLYNLA